MKRKPVRLAVASLVAVLSVFGLSQAPASAGMRSTHRAGAADH